MKKVFLLLCALSVLPFSWIQAEVKLPAIFSDHMVLQRDVDVPVWGWADAGEKVTVSFAGKTVTTTARDDGEWMLKLPAQAANPKPQKLKVMGSNEIVFNNVLIGDVWICSGQSNMEWPLRRCTKKADEVVAAAKDNTQLRMFDVAKHIKAAEPAENCPGSWETTEDANALLQFSGTGFFFGSKLQAELGIPIGLIGTNWGGTPVDEWISNEAYQELMDRGRKQSIYNGMVAPLVPYAIKGAIWYQGESNRGNAFPAYFEKMNALITGWREDFQVGDFPFYQVQIAPFKYNRKKAGDDTLLAKNIWASQFKAAEEIKNCGMVPIHDTLHGNITDIHPWDKQPVGERLAMLALKDTYGKEVPHSGPEFASAKASGKEVIVSFDGVVDGLATFDGKDVAHFELAGADGEFVAATAEIVGNTVVVSAIGVDEPKQVRMGWNETHVPNLADKNGWPVFQFPAKKVE
ncbi:MAG: sialate O-acetylesterase [Akkermansiaceae bacterium]|nr:sialate O-acetylesterase [Akkermansiaceae bacterium]